MTYPVIDLAALSVFFLFFMRVIGIFTSAPIFGTRNIPPQVKAGMAIIIAYIFYLNFGNLAPYKMLDLNIINYTLLCASELLIGLIIGFVALAVFGVIQFAGHMIDVMTGMQIASVLDPMTQTNQSLLGQLQYIIAILLFLFFNGHHYILIALYKSFTLIPLGQLTISLASVQTFTSLVNYIFIVGVQLSAPIIAILFLIDLSLGIIAKGVPQMNVFLTGMPLKSLVGFATIFYAFIYFGAYFSKIPQITYENIILVLKSL